MRQETPIIAAAQLREVLSHWHANDLLLYAEGIEPARYGIIGLTDLATALRTLLLNAMGQLRTCRAATGSSEAILAHSLLYRQYVLGQSTREIYTSRNISEATFHRQQREELAELIGILHSMAQHNSLHLFPADLSVPEVFIGRDGLVEKARQILTSAPSEVTVALVGLPGAGKTSLASVLANDAAISAHFTDGVLWAGLGQTGDPARHLRDWAAQLRLTFDAASSLSSADLCREVSAALVHRRVLIVIDDVWQSDDVRPLLAGGSRCAHLITTRAPALAHEFTHQLLRVEELPPEDIRGLLRWYLPNDLLQEADIEPTLLDDPAVLARIGSLPLEVELAGQQLQRMARIGLSRRFEQFLYAEVDGTEQHATQQARIAQSVAAMPLTAQQALAALAIVPPKPNGLGEEDALVIANCNQSTLDLLIEVGLVQARRGRIMLHSSIAQYAAGLGDGTAVRQRLVQYFAQRLSGEQKSALTAQDVLNIRTALEIADTLGLHDYYVTLATRALWLFEAVSATEQAQRILENALSKAPSPEQKAAIDVRLARVRWLLDQSNANHNAVKQILKQAENIGDPETISVCHQTLAEIELAHARFKQAAGYSERAFILWKHVSDEQLLAQVGLTTIRHHMLQLNFESIRNWLVKVIPAGLERTVHSPYVNLALAGKGALDYLYGKVRDSERQLLDIYNDSRRRDYRMPLLFTCGILAWLYHFMGDYERCQKYGLEVIEAPDRDQIPDFVVKTYDALGLNAAAQGRTDEGLQLLSMGIDYSQARNVDSFPAALYISSARIFLQRGELDETERSATLGHKVAKAYRNDELACCSSALLGLVAAQRGQQEIAQSQFALALKLGKLNTPKANPWTDVFCRLHYGEGLLAWGDYAGALAQLKETAIKCDALLVPEYGGRARFGMAKTALAMGDREAAMNYGKKSSEELQAVQNTLSISVESWISLSR